MNSITDKPTNNTRKLTPKGTHVARCISIVDLGTGEETYKGETKMRRMLNVTWALPKCTIEIEGEQKPMHISKKFAASLNSKSTLRKVVDAWLAPTEQELANFDPLQMLGKEALVTITHYERANGETGASVGSVSSLPDGVTVPKTDTEPWSFDPCNPSVNWDKLLDWHRERVATSLEYKAAKANLESADDETDSIPF